MKVKLILLAVLAVTTMAFTGCNDDDNNYKPESVVVNAFEAKYPEATRVEWESKNNMKVVDFRLNGLDMEAWFESDGTWVMTESDIKFDALPEAVKAAYNASEYKASWRIDDVDKIERPNVDVMLIIEIEKGEQEMILRYKEDGTMLATPESVVVKAFETKYPGATRVEWESKNNMKVVDFRLNGIDMEAWFESDGTWVMTEWDILFDALPEAVKAAYNASEYKASWRIDDVDKIEKPNVDVVLIIEIEKGEQEMILRYKEDGTLIVK